MPFILEFLPSPLCFPPSVFHSDIGAPLTVVATALLLLPSCGGRVNCTTTPSLPCSPLTVGLSWTRRGWQIPARRAFLPAQPPLFPHCLPLTDDDLVPTAAISNGHKILNSCQNRIVYICLTSVSEMFSCQLEIPVYSFLEYFCK